MDVTIGEVALALETFICGMALELGLQSGYTDMGLKP